MSGPFEKPRHRPTTPIPIEPFLRQKRALGEIAESARGRQIRVIPKIATLGDWNYVVDVRRVVETIRADVQIPLKDMFPRAVP